MKFFILNFGRDDMDHQIVWQIENYWIELYTDIHILLEEVPI